METSAHLSNKRKIEDYLRSTFNFKNLDYDFPLLNFTNVKRNPTNRIDGHSTLDGSINWTHESIKYSKAFIGKWTRNGSDSYYSITWDGGATEVNMGNVSNNFLDIFWNQTSDTTQEVRHYGREKQETDGDAMDGGAPTGGGSDIGATDGDAMDGGAMDGDTNYEDSDSKKVFDKFIGTYKADMIILYSKPSVNQLVNEDVYYTFEDPVFKNDECTKVLGRCIQSITKETNNLINQSGADGHLPSDNTYNNAIQSYSMIWLEDIGKFKVTIVDQDDTSVFCFYYNGKDIIGDGQERPDIPSNETTLVVPNNAFVSVFTMTKVDSVPAKVPTYVEMYGSIDAQMLGQTSGDDDDPHPPVIDDGDHTIGDNLVETNEDRCISDSIHYIVATDPVVGDDDSTSTTLKTVVYFPSYFTSLYPDENFPDNLMIGFESSPEGFTVPSATGSFDYQIEIPDLQISSTIIKYYDASGERGPFMAESALPTDLPVKGTYDVIWTAVDT